MPFIVDKSALYFRASNEKKELEAKLRAADSQTKASAASVAAAAPMSSDSQTQLLELKKRNDELEDEVSLLHVLVLIGHVDVFLCTDIFTLRKA